MRQGIKFFAIALLSLIACQNLTAQLCQGSLGDPIVNITFGAGSNPGPQLAAASTGYQFVPSDCPQDGYYVVRNNTVGCFQNSWHTLSSDHTGDPNGYFMLVNASITPSAFYVDTVRGLCSNTTYEFAAWIINILQQSACNGAGIEPNLTFSIEKTDGTLLQSYNTGFIPTQASPTWQQFGFFFTTPASVSDVVVRIYNNSNGGCGNDLALDDITFRACGPKLTPIISGVNSTTAPVCEGIDKSYTFNVTISAGFTNPSLQWQQNTNGGAWTDIAGAITTTYSQDFPATTPVGNYNFRLTAVESDNAGSLQCRVVSPPLTIQVGANPVAVAISNSPVCENSTLTLTGRGGVQYAWTGANNFSATGSPATINNIPLNGAGSYQVQVTDNNGCTATATTTVTINPAPQATTSFAAAAICNGKSIQLASSGGVSYTWAPAATLSAANIASPVASPTQTTQYVLTVTNELACSDTASVLVEVNETPTANAGPDRTIIAGSTITLAADATGGGLNYSWTPALYIDDAHLLQPAVTPPVDVEYQLTASSTNGCGTATDSMHVFVYKGIFIPSAFSPNGDGLNETWKIPALNAFPSFELSVFNRFGQLVFQNKNTNQPWDGTYKGLPAEAGTYVYVIDLKKAPGVLKGTILLIR